MTGTTSILPFRQGGGIDEPLTASAPDGARRILVDARAAKADAFVAAFGPCAARGRAPGGGVS